jgi:hypothetical protein
MEICRRRKAWTNRLRPRCKGNVPEGPTVERSAFEQGPGRRFRNAALVEGLSYQALISSLLHKYASGRLKEV